jgi:hypothetical protein
MYEQGTNQAPVHSIIKVELALYSFKQTEGMSNAVYLEKMKSVIEVYEHASGKSRTSATRVTECTDMTNVDPNNPALVRAARAIGMTVAR